MVRDVKKLGVLSSRRTNPLMPIYQALGRTETNLRPDASYAEPWKELPIKKTYTKTDWKKTSIAPIVEETNVEHNVFRENESLFAQKPNVSLLYKRVG